MGCIFLNKLVSQKQPSKAFAFHKINIFQVTDNSQGVIWYSSKILKKHFNNNNEKRKKSPEGEPWEFLINHRVSPRTMSESQSNLLWKTSGWLLQMRWYYIQKKWSNILWDIEKQFNVKKMFWLFMWKLANEGAEKVRC